MLVRLNTPLHRPKAASEVADLGNASKLLGHTDTRITQTIYGQVGEVVAPHHMIDFLSLVSERGQKYRNV